MPQSAALPSYEKLGVFYLGKEFEPEAKTLKKDYLLYDSKDLVTHGVVVGMTGSGKTGLCLSILEEAAIDNIPAIVVDPKGDLANLMLLFPELRGSDFLKWVNTDDARKRGLSPEDFAKEQAEQWKKGLGQWDQDGERIQRLKDAADFRIFTPGSNAGLPVSILHSFDSPPVELRQDSELLRERVNTTGTSLLGLLGIEADPIQSREHILLSMIFATAWKAGKDMTLAALIQQIQSPPSNKVGVLDLETFFPGKERFELAMQFNNLLASPSFETWMEGQPLDIQSILYTPQGKPRIAIFSIAHLNDSERMFFVSLLMNQILGWMRQQPGTTSLRALVYMDEIFGYFPPVKNPPSKTPMLTLLKQARAFGVGMLLATQNPVDIDYKGLSNCGTWFIGRLQTERDKLRVLDGLEGASTTQGVKFDRQDMERTISSLGNRVFLMNNVHDDHPVVFQTRWALCYLRGPLTRQQIKELTDPIRGEVAQVVPAKSIAATMSADGDEHQVQRPVLSPDVPQFFAKVAGEAVDGAKLLYRPRLLGCSQIYFNDAKAEIELTHPLNVFADIGEGAVSVNWTEGEETELTDEALERSPAAEECLYSALAPDAARAKNFDTWKRSFAEHIYRNFKLEIYKSDSLGKVSKPGETERDFRVRLQQMAREQRDQAAEQLRQKYAPKIQSLDERIRKAMQMVEKQKSKKWYNRLTAILSFAGTILGAFTSRKMVSATNISKATTAMKGAARSMKDVQDEGIAEDNVQALEQRRDEIKKEFDDEVAAIETQLDPLKEELEQVTIKPKKTNITVRLVALTWLPHWKQTDGSEIGAWE
ncbi:MAG: hypothetical protein K2X38_08070 [Gemmataceae bacterium]|nr:hypothetical protein [Gemmataceae bacterium]